MKVKQRIWKSEIVKGIYQVNLSRSCWPQIRANVLVHPLSSLTIKISKIVEVADGGGGGDAEVRGKLGWERGRN